MIRFIKIFAVWILVIALPLQGYAAAAMMNCEPSHSHMALSSVSTHDHIMHDEAITHDNSDHHHDADISDNDSSQASNLTKHTCNACSVCCSSSAIATSAFKFELGPI